MRRYAADILNASEIVLAIGLIVIACGVVGAHAWLGVVGCCLLFLGVSLMALGAWLEGK